MTEVQEDRKVRRKANPAHLRRYTERQLRQELSLRKNARWTFRVAQHEDMTCFHIQPRSRKPFEGAVSIHLDLPEGFREVDEGYFTYEGRTSTGQRLLGRAGIVERTR